MFVSEDKLDACRHQILKGRYCKLISDIHLASEFIKPDLEDDGQIVHCHCSEIAV